MGKALSLDVALDKMPGLDGIALCCHIIDGLDYTMDGFCRISKLVPSKKNGYVQVSWGGANHFCVLGELLLWSRGVTLVNGNQGSHLCGKPPCLVAEHLCSETARDNNLRKGCMVWVDCFHCDLKYHICTHLPPCVKFCPGFGSVLDFLASGIHIRP
jgi:hypothetical protein